MRYPGYLYDTYGRTEGILETKWHSGCFGNTIRVPSTFTCSDLV